MGDAGPIGSSYSRLLGIAVVGPPQQAPRPPRRCDASWRGASAAAADGLAASCRPAPDRRGLNISAKLTTPTSTTMRRRASASV